MSSHQRTVREPVKRRSSSDQRRAMTERRHEMAGAIRKARKSHAVALKRRVTSGAGTGTAAISPSMATDETLRVEVANLAEAYIKSSGSPNEVAALSALQTALAKSEDGTCSKAIESLLNGSNNEDTSGPALLLAETLAKSLSQSMSATAEIKLDAARVLTNLAVCGGGDASDLNATDYYGNVAENWCDILIRSSAIRSMIDNITIIMQQPPHQTSLVLCEQCCWALGNIAGDSQRSRDALRSAGTIRPLICTLRVGLGMAAPAGNNEGEKSTGIVGLCRNAAWALSNLARGSYSSAMPFLQVESSGGMDSSSNEGGLLTPGDLCQVMSVHELSQYQKNDTAASSWTDVAIEISWLLALLTGKEDEAVDFLFSDNNSSNSFCTCLASTLQKLSIAASSPDNNMAEVALRVCVPCIRIVGNIAASCDGKYVPNLLTHAAGDSLAISITRIIQLGAQRGRDFAVLASEACWASGALLVDAGTAHHPSTASCEVFIPALCNVLTSASSKIELRREAASALCNAVAAPPPPSSQQTSPGESGQATRDQILRRIASTEDIVRNLTSLLISFDADAVFSALMLVNDILRRLANSDSSIKTLFEEANIVDALETICDRASAASSYGNEQWRGNGSAQEKSAEIAADLIDDLFDDDLDDDNEDANQYTGTSTYAFGNVEPPSRPFDFAAAQATSNSFQGPSGRPSGRGRGKAMPAWMSQQQN